MLYNSVSKARFIALSITTISLFSAPTPQDKDAKYFDTKFLIQYDQVQESLIKEEGFQEVYFTTSDGMTLQGLLRLRPEARYSVIFCAGFQPGRKEGLASFIKMVSPDCNILFFDTRGHGKSSGDFWSLSYLSQYGLHEYKDIVAAIEYMHSRADVDIILHSICVGSFHAARALINLEQLQLREQYRIRGFIFDSGIISIMKSRYIPYEHMRTKLLPAFLISTLYKNDTKKSVQERYVYKACWLCTAPLLQLLIWSLSHKLPNFESTTTIWNKIQTIECPIFFIHASEDSYSPINDIQCLASQANYSTCWWVEHSEHTINHLKHTDEYRERLNKFITITLSSTYDNNDDNLA
jgi:pimeloyl-ACP methyl ester carboxylesterase